MVPACTVIDGPFAETRELVAGFWLWDVKDMDEAVAQAKRCPEPHAGAERRSKSGRCTRRLICDETLTPDVSEIYDCAQDAQRQPSQSSAASCLTGDCHEPNVRVPHPERDVCLWRKEGRSGGHRTECPLRGQPVRFSPSLS